MHCIPIIGPTFEKAKNQLLRSTRQTSLIEFRIDLFEFDDIEILRKMCTSQVIFTLREKELKDDQKVRCLLALNPDYVDVDHNIPSSQLVELLETHSQIKWIVSLHNFENTPDDLESVFTSLKENVPSSVWGYKIATYCNSSLDAMRLLVMQRNRSENCIVIGMGEMGKITRILAPIFSNTWTFCSITPEQASAPGQIPIDELNEIYHFRQLNINTKIYALIGNPLHLSLGDVVHNATFHKFHQNCVYVKIPIQEDEFFLFLKLAEKLSFSGLSITMPLKNCFLEKKAGGPINTLKLCSGKWEALNTDGIGGVHALEKQVGESGLKDKRVLILGAGGAAEGLARALSDRSANITILNRTVDKAKMVATALPTKEAIFGPLDQLTEKAQECDILINTLPHLDLQPMSQLSPSVVIMDIVSNPVKTPLITKALQNGNRVVYGYEMFIYQAVEQQLFWRDTEGEVDQNEIFPNLIAIMESLGKKAFLERAHLSEDIAVSRENSN